MPSMDPALKRLFIRCLDEIKENYRKADGELDKSAAVNGALALMGKDSPEERAWWDTLSPHAFGEVVAGEYTRRRRKHIRDGVEANHYQSHPTGDAHAEFDPSPAELESEYDVPIGGGKSVAKQLGHCLIKDLNALERLFERMETGNAKTKVYIRQVKKRARQRQLQLDLDESATLFQIFGAA